MVDQVLGLGEALDRRNDRGMNLRTLTDAILVALGTIAAAPPVGDGKAPEPPATPYVMLYSDIADREIWRSLSGGLAGMELVYQVSVVAENRTSLDVISDQIRVLMLDPAVSLDSADVKVSDRRLTASNLQDDAGEILVRRDLRFRMSAVAA